MIDVKDEPVDVIVIGSGFGGSVAANRLGLAGQRVLVLERGPWRDSLPVRSMGINERSAFPYGTKVLTHLIRAVQLGSWRLSLSKHGMFEFFSFKGLSVLAASGVGGGSLAYGGLLVSPGVNYWQGRHPALNPTDIERYYPKVIADLGGERISPEHCLPQSVWTHLPTRAGALCMPVEPGVQPHMATLLPRTPSDIGRQVRTPEGIDRNYCAFDGDSFLGSRQGAKASVDFVYLAPVLDKGVAVRDLCQVLKISRVKAGDGSAYKVHYKDLRTGFTSQVQAAQVVLAAGTMNTVSLLFTSQQASDGLVPMPSLGRNFGANSDLMGAWIRPGHPASSFKSPPSLGEFKVLGHEAATLGAGGLPGIDTLPLPAFLKRKLEKVFFVFGFGADSSKNSLQFKGGKIMAKYDQRGEPVYATIRAAMRKLHMESGDRTLMLRTPLTVHQWGGASLGSDASQGVVNHRGEVYGNPGLFIADGSALPAALGTPPAVGISAWAHHVADSLLKDV